MTKPTVSLLASVHPLWREEVLTRLRAVRPELVVVRHELATIDVDGSVHRTVARPATEDVALAVGERCCLSCLLRDDTLALLSELAEEPGPLDVLVVLPVAVEPVTVAVTLGAFEDITLDTIVVAIDAQRIEDDLVDGAPLDEPGVAHDDPRSHAEMMIRQLRHADLVIHTPVDERGSALLEAVSPRADLVPATTSAQRWLGRRRHRHDELLDELQSAAPRTCRNVDRAGVRTGRWFRRRPLHPGRLLDTLEDGSLLGVVRAHGCVWVATRPKTVLELEVGFDGCELAAVDAWLTATPDVDPARVPPGRRTAAEARWHPYYGDRVQELVVVTLDRDLEDVVRILDDCLLTDRELAEGEQGWLSWPDPFATWLGAEAAFLGSTADGPHIDEEAS
ncbi:MAG: hypothetical protein EA340_14635 [Nitriliruptor sp.]|nr:MAG: hypothetical protein EA340_14635 [Nitriliruptor sp.]